MFAMSRKFVNLPNFLCVCGEFTLIVKKAYELNLGIKLGIRTRTGHRIRVAVDLYDIYDTGSLACTSQYLSQSLWFGENKRIIFPIATFV